MATRRCSTPDRVHSEDTPKAAKYPDYCRTLTFTDNNGVVRELVFPKALDLDRPKRARTTFSRDQLERLEAEFTANQYLVGRERTQLATTLGLSETQVKVWFQNRRTKHKREKEKQEENQDAKSESLAVRNLLTSLPPSHVTFPAGSAAREPSSLTPFTSSSSSSLHNLPAPCLPRPGAGERDGLPAACSSSPAPCPEDTATLLTTTSRLHHPALPRVSTTVTPTPLYAKDQTALGGGGGGGGGTLVHPLSRLGAPPDLRHGGCVPVCSLSSLPGADSPILAAAVRAGTCAPFSGRAIGSGDCALGYGSLRSGAGVPETWGWYPGDVTACQRPVGPVMARAGPIPAAWPLYCHSLTP